MAATQRRARTVQSGSVSVTLVGGNINVVFPTAMPSVNYDILQKIPNSGVAITSVTTKTAAGFTVALAVTLAGTFDWVVVEQLT